MFTRSRIAAGAAVLGLTGLGMLAAPAPAQAWWGGPRFGLVLPPVVVAPPPVYYAPPPPPAYYAPPVAYYAPHRYWVRPHWRAGYWVPGHWNR